MADSSHTGSGQWIPAKTSYQDHTEETPYYENATTSRSNQALIPLITLLFGFITIGLCIAAIIWLWLEGPTLVPSQDRQERCGIFYRACHLQICVGFCSSSSSQWQSYSYPNLGWDLSELGIFWTVAGVSGPSSFFPDLSRSSRACFGGHDRDIGFLSLRISQSIRVQHGFDPRFHEFM